MVHGAEHVLHWRLVDAVQGINSKETFDTHAAAQSLQVVAPGEELYVPPRHVLQLLCPVIF